MKKYSLLLLLIIFAKLLAAQDTIVKTNGEIIPAKIIEINPSQIKYKKYTFLDGPTYIEDKSAIKFIKYSTGLKEVFSTAEEAKSTPIVITPVTPEPSTNVDYYNPREVPVRSSKKMQPYGSAKYRFDNRVIGEREMHSILMKTNNREIVGQIQMAKDAHALQFVGFAAIPFGVAALYFLGTSINMYGQFDNGKLATSAIMLCGAIACPIVSGVYKHKRTMSNRKAVDLYNQVY